MEISSGACRYRFAYVVQNDDGDIMLSGEFCELVKDYALLLVIEGRDARRRLLIGVDNDHLEAAALNQSFQVCKA